MRWNEPVYAPLPETAEPTRIITSLLWVVLIFVIAIAGAAILAAIGAVIAAIIMSATGAIDIQAVDPDNPPMSLILVVIGLFLLFLFMLVWLLSVWRIKAEGRSLATAGFRGFFWGGTFWKWFFLGIVFAVAVSSGVIFAGGEAGGVPDDIDMSGVFDGTLAVTLLILLGILMVQAPAEEVMFRGWILSALSARNGIIMALIFSSLWFMIVHGDRAFYGGWMLFYTFVAVGSVGVLLGAIAISTRHLSAPAGFHTGYNFTLLALLITALKAMYKGEGIEAFIEGFSAQMAEVPDVSAASFIDLAIRFFLPVGIAFFLLSRRKPAVEAGYESGDAAN